MNLRFWFFTVILLSPALQSFAESTHLVQVQSATLRAEPKYWGAEVATLTKGATVTEISEADGWYKVKASGGKSGYIHKSALIDRSVLLQLTGGDTSTKASASDISLAGKGFSKAIEQSYSASHPALNFSAVNEVQQYRVANATIRSFAKEGKLLQ